MACPHTEQFTGFGLREKSMARPPRMVKIEDTSSRWATWHDSKLIES
jgi:hypothetical protein